jgi:hypothetical protein
MTTTNRATRRATASKKKGGKTLTKTPANGKSNGFLTPKLSAAQKKGLRKIRDAITASKSRIADLEMEKARMLAALGQQNSVLQDRIKSALQGAGVDFEEGPQGSWAIDFDTMEVSFEAAPEPVTQPS